MAQSKYPREDGWMTATLEMKSSEIVDPNDVKNILSWGKPEKNEWGPMTQHGKKVKVIFREKKTEAETAAADS